MPKRLENEGSEIEDVTGHKKKLAETEDDTEGNKKKLAETEAGTEDDDVEGHVRRH